MSSIYNVKTLTLNGNQVTRFAEHYNPYNRNKDKTLISQQALEELFKSSEVPCDYTFAKQHLLNTTYGNITVKPDNENEYYDITYGLHINLFDKSTQTIIHDITKTDSFIYDWSESGENILKDIETKKVYIPQTAKVFGDNKILNLALDNYSPATTSFENTTITVQKSSEAKYFGIIFEKKFFVAEDKHLLFTESLKDTVISSGGKKINNTYMELYESDFIQVDGGYQLADDNVELIVNNVKGATFELIFANDVKPFETHKIYYYGYTGAFKATLDSSSPVEEIIIDKFFPVIISSTADSNLKDVYYNAVLRHDMIQLEKGNLHVNASYKELGLGEMTVDASVVGVPVQIKCETIYLGQKFFDNVNLDTARPGQFGNWNAPNSGDEHGTVVGKVIINRSNLYTSEDNDDELIKLLRKLLGLAGTVPIELED